MKKILPILALLFAVPGGLKAQTPISNLVATVGTTVNTNGTTWSYLLIGSPQAQLLAGKRFAIYSKPGYPTNSSTFTLRSTLFQQNDPNAIGALLAESQSLGQDFVALDKALTGLLHSIPNVTNLTVAQKVALAFQVAFSDSGAAQALAFLAPLHPGLMLCEGLAFAEPITVTTTYEVRDVNLASGAAGDVVGRVTLTTNAPALLPAPGAPFQVVTNDPSDHLRIRLRWGTPDELRRLSLLTYGFNVWRISSIAYVSNLAGIWHGQPPTTPQQIRGDPSFTNVNTAPVMAAKDYNTNPFNISTNPGGVDDPSDRLTYFYADSNAHPLGRPHFPTSRPPNYPPGAPGAPYPPPAYTNTVPFNDGDIYYYFVTTRDILGRDGAVSAPGMARAYRRIPPQAPAGVRVRNSFQVISVNPPVNQQALKVSWQQNLDTNDLVTEYWVYRWPNPAMAHTNDSNPYNNRLLPAVPQIAGTNNSYLDNGMGAPLMPGLSNFWYTVRAVSQTVSGQTLLSPHSPAAWGVLRERFGPVGTSGDVQGSCGTPAVILRYVHTNLLAGTPDISRHYRFTCQRRDHGIAWVQFFATNLFAGQIDTLGPLYFDPDSDLLSIDYSPSGSSTNDNAVAGVGCIVGTFLDDISQPANAQFLSSSLPGQEQEAVFYCGQLLFTAFSTADPLAAVARYGSNCLPAVSVKAYPEGTVGLRFNFTNVLLIQVQTNADGSWSDVAVSSPDTNGFYWISYTDCLLKPLPPFQGCLLNLSGDCARHVSGGALDGPKAPIQIRFRLRPRTHEYRLYRTVNDGPRTLIAQGAALYDGQDPSRYVVVTDNVMPPSTANLCYYVQLLDQHGNGSPMTFLGCKEVKPPKPARPLLAEPHSGGDSNNPLVVLNWFCPTSGVYRFRIDIQPNYLPNADQPSGVTSSNLFPFHFVHPTGNNPTYYGLREHAVEPIQFQYYQLTPPVGPNFGPGPQFNLTANVQTNQLYYIAVLAQDDQGIAWDHSQVWKFIWKVTNGPPEVPWPARPQPPLTGFDDYLPTNASPAFRPRVSAVLQHGSNGGSNGGLDANYPVGIRIGQLTGIERSTNNIGNTNFPTFSGEPLSLTTNSPPRSYVDPSVFIFKRQSNVPERSGESLLPIVVYRQQVTNSVFPRVSGNVTQVTPLLEQIAWSTNACPGCLSVTIYDRLIAMGTEYDPANGGTGLFFYLRDQQPVIVGASYQYFVVRFDHRREISEIIPAGTITIPSPP